MRVTLKRDLTLSRADSKLIASAHLPALLRSAGDQLGVAKNTGVAVLLTNDAQLRLLNRTYSGTDHATDVLAFPAGEKGWQGDIAISVERARGQRPEDPVSELRLLAVHGLLHCLGYDHATAVDAAAMTAATRKLLGDAFVPELVSATAT